MDHHDVPQFQILYSKFRHLSKILQLDVFLKSFSPSQDEGEANILFSTNGSDCWLDMKLLTFKDLFEWLHFLSLAVWQLAK